MDQRLPFSMDHANLKSSSCSPTGSFSLRSVTEVGRGLSCLFAVSLLSVGCGGEKRASDDAGLTTSSLPPGGVTSLGEDSATGSDAGDSGADDGADSNKGGDSPSTEASAGDSSPSDDDSSGDGSDSNQGIRFDVPDSNEGDHALYCGGRSAGIYCDGDKRSYECSDDEKVSNFTRCSRGVCEEGVGCIVCQDGQFKCLGDQVLECDTSGEKATWQKIASCTPPAETCDTRTGTCIAPQVIGTAEPTGVYYKFMSVPFDRDAFNADTYENLLYVTSGGNIHVYELDLLDSDGDGELEPNQHPDNPDATGPIEERTVEFIEEISLAGAPFPIEMTNGGGLIENEIFAQSDRLYYLTGTHGMPASKVIVEYVFATGAFNVISPPAGNFGSQLGYDELNDLWYAGNEYANRAIYQFDPASNTWGLAFMYPHLAGSHADGLEVVQARTVDSEGRIEYGETYVYVTDMTSDFIGQYRYDAQDGWVQENLFQYDDDTGQSIEGMGFGYLNHFWVAAYGELYELGGGDLAKFVEPIG